jgi:hypothetical protein
MLANYSKRLNRICQLEGHLLIGPTPPLTGEEVFTNLYKRLCRICSFDRHLLIVPMPSSSGCYWSEEFGIFYNSRMNLITLICQET